MTISFGLPSPRHVQVTVSDIQGREVAVLTDEEQPAGEHAVTWDGCAAEHHQASPGLYFVRLAAGDEVRIQKLLLVR
jgi:flagellar hook assembly protein FlgD